METGTNTDTFHSKKAVFDIDSCPSNPSVLAFVGAAKTLHIWDNRQKLAESSVSPPLAKPPGNGFNNPLNAFELLCKNKGLRVLQMLAPTLILNCACCRLATDRITTNAGAEELVFSYQLHPCDSMAACFRASRGNSLHGHDFKVVGHQERHSPQHP